MRDAQWEWLEAALSVGVPSISFLVVEWELEGVERAASS
jgi:hypothetical protein